MDDLLLEGYVYNWFRIKRYKHDVAQTCIHLLFEVRILFLEHSKNLSTIGQKIVFFW